MRISLRALLGVSLLATGGCRAPVTRPVVWAQPLAGEARENLYLIEPGLYRGSLRAAEDPALLRRLGVTEVLCLCDSNPSTNPDIRKTCLPLTPRWVTDAQILAAVRTLRDRQGPALVHCQRGADRTGCVVAMYRILVQDWSRDAALREMERGGYGYFPGWLNLRHYVLHADVDRLRAALRSD